MQKSGHDPFWVLLQNVKFPVEARARKISQRVNWSLFENLICFFAEGLFFARETQLLQLLCEADSREEMERISTRKWLTALIPNDGIIRDLLSYRKELKTVIGTRASLG